MQHLKDPAAGVGQALLPHLHLVSKSRYPVSNNPSLDSIVGYLADAPKVVRDLQPMQWQMLDAPQDGTLLLVWQPLEYLGTNAASDGYVYADQEQYFKSEVRGYTLEMYLHRTGYRPGEPMSGHSRKRYRLVPSNPSMPNCDQSLFLITYVKAAPRDSIPSATIPIAPQVQQQMQQRRLIQAQGQLARKEFMLHDRSNWPTISAPQSVARGQGAHRRGGSTGEVTLEEEEDVSRGDFLDFMSPRDISRVRFEQHHEWMEEILESPYNISQIVPGDLGLGRKGPVEELTKDFFNAPITVQREATGDGEIPRVGRLENGKAEDFSKKAASKIAEMEAELEKMKQQHAQRLARLKRTSLLSAAEKKLRSAPTSGDRRTSAGSPTEPQPADAIDEIAEEVEQSLGRKIARLTNVSLVSAGGLDQRPQDRSMSTSSQTRPQMSPVKASASPAAPQQAAPSEQQTARQPSPQPATAPTQAQPADTQAPDDGVAPSAAVPQQMSEPPEETAIDGDGAQELDLDDVGDVGDDLDINMDGYDGNDGNDGNDGDHMVNPESDWVMDMDGSGDIENGETVEDVPEQAEAAQLETEAEKPEAIPQHTEPQPQQQQQPQPQPQQTSAEQTPNNGTPADHSSNEMPPESTEFDEMYQPSGGEDFTAGNDDLNLDGMDDTDYLN